MAQTRLVSIVAKQEVMENNIVQMQKLLGELSKILLQVKKKQFGRKGDMARTRIEADHLNNLLQSMHSINNLMLKVENLLTRCSTHSLFIQRQLELRNFQIV